MSGRQEQKPYTPEILAKAEALHDSGLLWEAVAERIGHSCDSLAATRSQRKRNSARRTTAERRAESVRRMAYTEALISLGMKPKEMQAPFKLSSGGVSMRLLSWGLDREERIALRLADERFAATLAKARAIIAEHRGGTLTQRLRDDLRKLKDSLLQTSELRRSELEALLHNPVPIQLAEGRSEI